MAHPPVDPSPELLAFAEQFPWERRTILRYMCRIASELEPGTRLLDVGAGEQPYLTSDWAGSVHEGASRVDIIAPADDLPVDEGSFDAVVCTQVLEHVAEPADVLAELFRVLRPGGRLYITVPLAWEEHEAPYDFFRYTRFGLRHLLESAGFGEIVVEPRNDAFSTVAQLLRNLDAATNAGGAADAAGAQRALATHTLSRLADLVADYAPLDGRWILPLGYHARATRTSPVDRTACRDLLGLADARPAAYVAYADQLVRDPGLLSEYAAAIGGDDPISLVVYAPEGDPHALTAGLEAAAARAGLDGEDSADLVAVALGERVDEAALARAVDGVDRVADALRALTLHCESIAGDVLITARLKEW
jgi:SAM-dependent methyltransferase